MAKVFIAFFVTLIILLITTEIISFRLTKDISNTKIKIDFNIFGITLTKSNEQTKKQKKRGKDSFSRRLSRIIFSSLRYLLSKSQVHIYSLVINIKEQAPLAVAIKRAFYISAVSTALSYLRSKTKNIEYDNIVVKNADNNLKSIPSFDIKITFPLLFFLIFLARLGFKHIKERINNYVGKQNE